jgi:uncharacterized protein
MPAPTDSFDLGGLRLTSGEARRLDLEVALGELEFSGERYASVPAQVPARLDVSRMVGGGYALRIRLRAAISGPCMRCLGPAEPPTEVDAREVDQPGGGEELTSPYLEGDVLDVQGWAHDAFVLALPAQLLCRPDCAGLCPVCGENLNEAGPEHHHDAPPDPRWAKLRELKLD